MFKFHSFLVFSFLFALKCSAQMTIIGSCPENLWAETPDGELSGTNKVKNETAFTGKFHWIITDTSIPSAWISDFQFCDPEFCYLEGVMEEETSFDFGLATSPLMNEGPFKPQFDPSTPGSGSVTACGWIVGDSAATVVCCTYAMTFNGIDEMVVSSSIHHYPNPVTDLMIIESPDYPVYEYELINIFGKIFTQQSFDQQQNKLEVSVLNLPNGLYFVKMKTSEGIIVSKSFIKN